ncbi:cell envelope integrity EipB family protein [Undibacter mobilis]|nr:cell envelope integrity EipB family protein [Undibacter mobilis]
MKQITFGLALPVLAALAAGLLTGTTDSQVRAAPIAAPVPPGEAAKAKPVVLASHRAVYDLKLAKSSGSRGIQAARGRILYDFSGSACDGYELHFRQVSQLDSGEGKTILSDLRSTTWENTDASKFRFNSENLLNDKVTDTVDGSAERGASGVKVGLNKPTSKTFNVPADVVFPTEHMRRIIEAARAGKTILEFPVYDGSDGGEKLYHTLTVIGAAIDPAQKPADDVTGKDPAMAGMLRWPVTVSYFDKKSEDSERTGEQTPVYAIAFELYENGISRALVLDYNDFTIKGDLSSLEMKKAKVCQ